MKASHIEQINQALSKNTFCILKEFADKSDLPAWDDIIATLNTAAHTKADFHVNDPFVELQINHAIRRGVGYFYSFFDDSDETVWPKLSPIAEELRTHGLEFEARGASVFLNLFTEDDFAANHKDQWSNNLYIQCEGSTLWTFYDNDDRDLEKSSRILNPGDAVFFTGDVYHAVSATTPRASIVLRMPREAAN